MPPFARNLIADPSVVESHHIWSRCVRGAHLFGIDTDGVDRSYRRQWVEALTEYLASVFAIDVGGNHILSNHLHDLLRSRPDIAATWSDEQVCWRWKMAWPQFDEGVWSRTPTDEAIEAMLQRGREQQDYLPKIRLNLSNISWFMARLKESIAKAANREVEKHGHHWEQRFGSRRLDDDGEILTALIYNDLQQTRLLAAKSLEMSDYSSIQRHLRAAAQRAYRDFHGRECGETDEELAELEQLEVLYANCFFSPINDDQTPMAMEVADTNIPATELVFPPQATQLQLPHGYVVNNRAAADAARPNPPPEKKKKEKEKKKRRRRRKAPKSRTIHKRMRRQQRRRASRTSILNIRWDHYLDLVQRIDAACRPECSSQVAPSAPAFDPSAPPGSIPDDHTVSNWRSQFRKFAIDLRDIVSDLPEHLANLFQPSARGDPPPSAPPVT